MIKLSILSSKFEIDTLYVDQQPQLTHFYKNLMPNPTHVVNLNSGDLNERFSKSIEKIGEIVKNYDAVIVQGDTMTAAAASLAAFNLNKKIAHVEAGLRTNNISSPFPEEAYRTIISRISTWNFCPTNYSAKNLKKENVPGKIYVTGNTVIDLVKEITQDKLVEQSNNVIVTLHRRENIPHLERLLQEIKESAEENSELNWILPVHPNPEVKSKVLKILKDSKIQLIDPIDYPDFIECVRKCKFIITDSGGIQEEAAFFRKKVIVCRESTERPEGLISGFSVLGFVNLKNTIKNSIEFPLKINKKNPYGDGTASIKIANILGLKIRVK